MSKPKGTIPLNSRVTEFVSRESGAAELQVSPDTWDAMDKAGQLAKPVMVGPNRDIKRWHWPTIVKRLLNDQVSDDLGAAEPYFRNSVKEQDHGASKDN